MWPKCRGRRLPVKLTGAPAPAPAADTGGGGPPLSLVVDCSVQGSETRVQAFAALPTSTAEGQSDGPCGCSRKPCCCLPGSETESSPTTQQQPMDQLRPVTYVPREALFRMRGGRKVRLTPVPASGSGGKPMGLIEQTRLLPRSKHRRLILRDTAAEGEGRKRCKRAPDTTSRNPGVQQPENTTQQVAGPHPQTSAEADTCRQCTNTAVEEAALGECQPEGLGGQQHLLFLLLPSAFPLRQDPRFGLPETPAQITHSTTNDAWRVNPYPEPFGGQQEKTAGRPETPIQGTNVSVQEAPHGNHRAETLDSQKEPSLSTFNRGTFSGDAPPQKPEQPCGNYSPARSSCQRSPLPSRPETPEQSINFAIIEVPHSDCNPERLSGQQEPVSSAPGAPKCSIHVPLHSDDTSERLSSLWESQSSKLETSKYDIQIPIQESPHCSYNPERLNGEQEALSSKLGTFKYGIQIQIQGVPHGDRNPKKISSQQEPLSTRSGTSRYGIHIPIQRAPLSDGSPDGLSGKQELLFPRPRTSNHCIHIPLQVAPHGGHSPENLRGQQKLMVSRSGTLKHGIYIPVQIEPHSGLSHAIFSSLSPKPGTFKHSIPISIQEVPPADHNANRLMDQQNLLSSRLGTSRHGIHIPVQVASHVGHSPERLSSQQDPLSSKLGISKYGIHIPIQEAPCSYCSHERLSGQQMVMSSRPGISKHGIHIPITVISSRDHHLGKLTGQHQHMTVGSEESIPKIQLLRKETPLEHSGPIHTTDKQTQMPEEQQEHVQAIPLVTEEEPQLNHRSWIFDFLLDPVPVRPKSSTQEIQSTTVERLQGDRLSELQNGQLQEVPSTSAHNTQNEQLEQMEAKVKTSIETNHSAIQGEQPSDHGPNHVNNKRTQGPARSEASVQGIPSTTKEDAQQDPRSQIFRFLQVHLFRRIQESIKRIQANKRGVFQEEHRPEESIRGQQQRVSAIRKEPGEDIHQVTKGELHTDRHPEYIRGLQGQILARPITTTEHISLTIDEQVSGEQKQISEKIKAPVQHVHTAVEKVLHENHPPEERDTQQQQLSATSQTSIQGIQPIMEHTPHEEEHLKHEQLSTSTETPIQGKQPTMEYMANEEEPLKQEQLSARSEPSMQCMQPIVEEAPHEEEPLKQEQLSVRPQTSMQSIVDDAPHEEGPLEQEQLSVRPQKSIQSIMDDAPHEEEPLEQEQLSARSQTYMQGIRHITEETPHEEEQVEQWQLSSRSQTSMHAMRSIMEAVSHEEEFLEQVWLSATPQESEQVLYPIMAEASCENHHHENADSQQVQKSIVATISKQDTHTKTEEVPIVDHRTIVRKKPTIIRPARSFPDTTPRKVKSPQGGSHPEVFSSLEEKVSEDQKPVEKPVSPSQKMAPGASGESLRYGEEQKAAKQDILRKYSNTTLT